MKENNMKKESLYEKAREKHKKECIQNAVAVIVDRKGNVLKSISGNMVFLNASLMMGQLWIPRTKKKQTAYLAIAEGKGDVIRIYHSNGYRYMSDFEEVYEADWMLNEAEKPWEEILCASTK